MSARNVRVRTPPRLADVTPVEPSPTEATRFLVHGDDWPMQTQSLDTSGPTPKNDDDGSTTTLNTSDSESPTSKNSDEPSTRSTRSWKTPPNVKAFAAQVNAVATMVLRDEIGLETARVYSGLARTIAQAMSTEVTRARFLAQEPDLSLEEDGEEGEAG